MIQRTLYLFSMMLFLTGCINNHPETPLPNLTQLSPVLLEETGPEQFLYWDLDIADYLWGTDLGEVVALDLYKDSLAIALGVEQLESVVQDQASQSHPRRDTSELKDGDAINGNLTHSGALGTIRPIHFLEAQILNYQLNRFPLFSHPTEFHGFILEHQELRKIRVYFGASDQPWPPKPYIIITHLKEDLKNGWTLKQHLHNHYEPAEDLYIGVMAPSIADAHYFQMLRDNYQVETALITNGFTTVELQQDELEGFAIE
jgi:hypothetical protein